MSMCTYMWQRAKVCAWEDYRGKKHTKGRGRGVGVLKVEGVEEVSVL